MGFEIIVLIMAFCACETNNGMHKAEGKREEKVSCYILARTKIIFFKQREVRTLLLVSSLN